MPLVSMEAMMVNEIVEQECVKREEKRSPF